MEDRKMAESQMMIEELLKHVENVDLKNLRRLVETESDLDKQQVLKALYTYALDKKCT
ncbi:hypothetical protein WN865_01150 [Tetragenococcus halophilus]